MQKRTLCSKCSIKPRRDSHYYCADCFNAYVRDWRKIKNPKREWKRRARAIAEGAFNKGYFRRKPCEQCGAADTHMHHPDYDYPLEIVWLCRDCHVDEHGGSFKPVEKHLCCRCEERPRKMPHSWCRECLKEYNREWYRQNQTKRSEKLKSQKGIVGSKKV